MSDPSKTEKATSKRRHEARDEGRVAKSMEISTAVMFLMMLILLKAFGQTTMDRFLIIMRMTFENLGRFELNESNFPYYCMMFVVYILWILWPFMLVVMAAELISNIAQVGWHVTWKSISPQFSRLNPITGLKNKFFSLTTLTTFFKSVLKMGIAAWIVYAYLKNQINVLLSLQMVSLPEALGIISGIVYQILLRVTIFMVILAILDYAYQKWKFEEDLKMSKEEVKEERKQSEGDPKVKAAIRRRQRELTRKRMVSRVPQADVVVTNPIHVAVAIHYDADKMSAPVVVAKGADEIAQNIKAAAKEHGIPIIENKPLAQSLYKLVDIDEQIPDALFSAVAEILTYVNKLTGKRFGIQQ